MASAIGRDTALAGDGARSALRGLFALAAPDEVERLGEREGTPARRMGFFTDTTLCIGCKACEVACKQWNQLPADGFSFSGNSYDNTCHLSETTWRHVAFVEQMDRAAPRWLMMSDVCKHCEQAPCQEACPTGALIYNQFGDVYVQPDVCNGCGYCIAACPFGVLARSSEDGHVHKCTLCYDRQAGGFEPACAKACPTESIQFGPIEELRDRADRRVADLRARGETDAYLYGAGPSGEYSALNAFFLLKDHPAAYNLPEQPHRPRKGVGLRYLASFGAAALLTVASAIAFARGTAR